MLAGILAILGTHAFAMNSAIVRAISAVLFPHAMRMQGEREPGYARPRQPENTKHTVKHRDKRSARQ